MGASSIEGARGFAELPAYALKHVKHPEELVECSMALLSISSDRDDTILVQDSPVDRLPRAHSRYRAWTGGGATAS